MAWWDNESLKAPRDRSDRYKIAFPDEYTPAEVNAAIERQEQQEAQRKLREQLQGI